MDRLTYARMVSAVCLAARSDLLTAERRIACLETSANRQSAVLCSSASYRGAVSITIRRCSYEGGAPLHRTGGRLGMMGKESRFIH